MFEFKIFKRDKNSKARVGKVITPHGVIETPCFVPVGTKATVKGLTPQDLEECGVQILFGNTYHLHLRPGEDVVEKFGGLAKFMSWHGPTITDSGGFQIFSLGRLIKRNNSEHSEYSENQKVRPSENLKVRKSGSPSFSEFSEKKTILFADDEKTEVPIVKISDHGVTFRSHIDGSLHEFTPEKSIEIQKKLGADLILVFDECPPHPSTYEYTKEATDRTHAWARRSLKRFNDLNHLSKKSQALFGIVQGGVFKNLREESARFISSLDFDGIAIGGVSVGESKKEMRNVLGWTSKFLPEDKPRHLLGIGEIDDIFDAIEWGMDTFDCVIPTRFGRYGIAFVSPPEGSINNKFRLQLEKKIYAKDKRPIAKDCNCSTCQNFTRAYIHHLFRSQELLAYRLVSYHNVFFLTNLVKKIRNEILSGRFATLKKEWVG